MAIPFYLDKNSKGMSTGLQFNPMDSMSFANWQGFKPNTFNMYSNGTQMNPNANMGSMILDMGPNGLGTPGLGGGIPSTSAWDKFNGWMGSDSAKNLGSIMGSLGSLGSAYLNYSSAQDALDEQKKQNAYLQKFANTQLANEVNTLRNRAGDIEAMRNWSITGNTDAVTPEQLAAWDTKGKEEANLKTMD